MVEGNLWCGGGADGLPFEVAFRLAAGPAAKLKLPMPGGTAGASTTSR